MTQVQYFCHWWARYSTTWYIIVPNKPGTVQHSILLCLMSQVQNKTAWLLADSNVARYYYLAGGAIVLGIIAVCLFPLWPMEARQVSNWGHIWLLACFRRLSSSSFVSDAYQAPLVFPTPIKLLLCFRRLSSSSFVSGAYQAPHLFPTPIKLFFCFQRLSSSSSVFNAFQAPLVFPAPIRLLFCSKRLSSSSSVSDAYQAPFLFPTPIKLLVYFQRLTSSSSVSQAYQASDPPQKGLLCLVLGLFPLLLWGSEPAATSAAPSA